MSWVRFHTSCRRHVNRPGANFDDTLDFYRSSASVELLGAAPGPRALPSRLMAQLARMSDTRAREEAVGIYAALDFDAIRSRALDIRNATYYLIALAVVCLAMVGLLGFFVVPELVWQFEQLGGPPPSGLLAWHGLLHWPVAFVALVCLVVGLHAVALRRLLEFSFDPSRRGLLWMLLPSRLRRRYCLLEAVIAAPVPELQDETARGELQALQHEGLRWQDELSGLVRMQDGLLVQAADRLARALLTVMGVLVAASVSAFVVGMYKPLFLIGSAL